MTQLQQVTAQTQLGSAQLQLPGSPAAPLMMLCATVSTPAPSMHQSRSSICVASCAKNRVVLKPSGPATAQASTSRSTDSEARQAEEHYSQDGKFHRLACNVAGLCLTDCKSPNSVLQGSTASRNGSRRQTILLASKQSVNGKTILAAVFAGGYTLQA